MTRHEKTVLVQSISTNSELEHSFFRLSADLPGKASLRSKPLQTLSCRGWLGHAPRPDSEPLLKTSERRGAGMSGMARRAEAGARKGLLKRHHVQASAAKDGKVQQRRLCVSYVCCGLGGPRSFFPPATKRLSCAPALPPACAACGSCGSACVACAQRPS